VVIVALHKIKVASFFSGIGGFDLALESLGMEVVFQCEILPFCKKILKKHWPDVLLEGDVRNVRPDSIPDSNLWCAGFPCQDLSLANQGKRRGLDGERSGLFVEFHRLLQHRSSKPEWLVIENVPGLLNSNNGNDFRFILQSLDELGYGLSWRVLDAKYLGTPQRRRRVYLVGSYRSMRSAEVLFDTSPIEVAPRAGLCKENQNARGTSNCDRKTNLFLIQHASIGRKPTAGPQAKGYRNDGEAYTLDSRGSADAVCKTDAPFGVREVAGFPKELDGNRYRSIGNAVAVPVIKWIGERILKTYPFSSMEGL
jgi:DNA (cytosine-5)-methyltransferase 1